MDARADALMIEVRPHVDATVFVLLCMNVLCQLLCVPFAPHHNPFSLPVLLSSQGDQILKKGGGFFSSMFGTASTTYEDAAERFSRAGMAYKGTRKCKPHREKGKPWTTPTRFLWDLSLTSLPFLSTVHHNLFRV